MRRSITAMRDSSKARDCWGWMPSYPELDQQIAHDWTWFRDEMPNVWPGLIRFIWAASLVPLAHHEGLRH
jgi:hypothetical protein